MISEEQKAKRKEGIGGSDTPIILGFSSFKTPYQLYLEKKGILATDEKMSPQQEWGNLLEPIVREKFARKNEVTVKMLDTLIHPINHFMLGNIDGYINEWDAVLEIKCASQFMAYEWGADGSDVIPMAYLLQVAHYCSVMNVDDASIAVLIGGHDYRQYKYFRDFAIEKSIILGGSAFWDAIKKDSPPPPVNQIDLKRMFPRHHDGKTISLSDDIYTHYKNLSETKTRIKELQEIEEESRFQIMKYMSDSECLIDEKGRPLVTWKANKKGARTFLLKGEKE